MSPDDKRHGEYAGYRAHRVDDEDPCPPCQRANMRYQKGLQIDLNRGHRRTMPALGARRRIQALQAIGWSLRTIAREAGWRHHETLRWILLPENERILRSTHDTIAAVYDRLSMRVPERNSNTTRAKKRAAAKGYPPPLAWDDIDNDEHPEMRPERRFYSSEELAAEWDFLRRSGLSMTEAATRLGITPKAIEKALTRTRKAA